MLFDAYGIALANQQDDDRTSFFSIRKIYLDRLVQSHCLSLLRRHSVAGRINMMIPKKKRPFAIRRTPTVYSLIYTYDAYIHIYDKIVNTYDLE